MASSDLRVESPAQRHDPDRYQATPSEPSPADDVYQSHIQQDPEICNTCFRRVRHVILPHSYRRQTKGGLVRYYKAREGIASSEHGAADVASNPPRACQCGEIDTQLRPLSKSDALKAAFELSARLTAKGHEHNPLVLVATVTLRKTCPKFATRDDDTFEQAVANALDRTGTAVADLLLADYDYPPLPSA